MSIETSIPDRFFEQVNRHPDRLAISARDRSLTYAELGRATNIVANALLRLAGRVPERVVLVADQGIPAVVATLGILRAGGAYVPLDPSLPTPLLSEVITRTDPTLIVANRHYLDAARAAVANGTPVVCIEDIERDGDSSDPKIAVGPDTLAYIYFTSGSTGKPKGVCDNHRNALHNVWRYTKHLKIGMEDRLTLLPSPPYSAAISSMFCAFLNGAASFPYDVKREGLEHVAGWLRSNRITMFHSVPAIFREVILGGDCPAMRCIRLEGDRATAADIELFRRHCAPDSMLANGLGASECGLVRQWRITRHTPLPDGPLPIGTAMDDMEIILLDEHQHEVSEGAVGEIAVRSRYVAVGYWGQPQLTAARFLANQADPTLRTYLTGDLGRMLPGGLLQYCGRKDFVPKIRGEFVDLDTIERALGTIPAVRESVVVIREEDGRDPQLVAYVVPQPGTKPTAHALRSELAQRVPQAMVPSAWVLLEKIPLNANLKVDRKAMLKLVPETTTDEAEYVAPRTTLETQLASIWCEVLEIDRIGVHQNVFDIGADSIRIAKVRSRISAALSTEVPIRMIFEQLTIAEQADEVGTLVASTR